MVRSMRLMKARRLRSLQAGTHSGKASDMNATPSELTRRFRASRRKRSVLRGLWIGLCIVGASVILAFLLNVMQPAIPWIGSGWVVLTLVVLVRDCVGRRRVEKQIGGTACPLDTVTEGEFRGLLSLGFEVQLVTVATGRRRFVVWPVLENWSAVFPEKLDSDTDLPPSYNRGPDSAAGWLIRFVGIPSDIGRYGHMGICRREVRISRILEAKPIEI